MRSEGEWKEEDVSKEVFRGGKKESDLKRMVGLRTGG